MGTTNISTALFDVANQVKQVAEDLRHGDSLLSEALSGQPEAGEEKLTLASRAARCMVRLQSELESARQAQWNQQCEYAANLNKVSERLLSAGQEPLTVPSAAPPGTDLTLAVRAAMTAMYGTDAQKIAYLRSRGWTMDASQSWYDPQTSTFYHWTSAVHVQIWRDLHPFRFLLNAESK